MPPAETEAEGLLRLNKQAIIRCFTEPPSETPVTFSGACARAGIAPVVGYRWRDADVEFDNAVAELLEKNDRIKADWGEKSLVINAHEGDTVAARALLEAKGKDRGYAKDASAVTINLTAEVAEKTNAERMARIKELEGKMSMRALSAPKSRVTDAVLLPLTKKDR